MLCVGKERALFVSLTLEGNRAMAAALNYSCTVQRGRNELECVTVNNTYVWMISVRFEEKCEESECENCEFEEIGPVPVNGLSSRCT